MFTWIGETAVTLPFDNIGLVGRNQKIRLSAAITLHESNQNNKYTNTVITSMGTDRPIDAAGVCINTDTISRMNEYNVNLS